VNRTILRSPAAILVGWLVVVGGCLVTMTAIALLNPEAFKPAMHHSVGWWLVHLSVGLTYSVVGGFVTGVVAQRREIAHAIRLVLFGLLAAKCMPSGRTTTMSVPTWYWIAGYVLTFSFTIVGGWLRMRQRILLDRGSTAMIRATERVQFVIGLFGASATFVLALFVAGALGIAGLTPILDRLFGAQHPGTGILPCFLAFLLSAFAARYVFQQVVGMRASFRSDGVGNDGVER
jgi:hypothetical protein